MTASASNNPLGLNIDFMFGRGYLWAKQSRLSDWITLESLRMEIPDLQFPFDARGGLHRFRHTRCLVREIEMSISEAGLQDLLHQAAQSVDGFESLKLRFLEDAIHVSVRLRFFGADTHLSFRVALIPPEPARADELHLSLYDYRAFGPLPYPARLLAYELLTTLLGTPTLKPPGRGRSFTVGIAGDILSFRPLKLMLLHLFPRVGWKLPNLAGVLLDGAKIRPGKVTIRASGRDDAWYTIQQDQFHLSASAEGARALAAYEAKDLFSHVDQAIFEGKFDQAVELLNTFRDVYGAHPELNARAFDCLLADPSPQHIAEAGALLQELEKQHADELHHALAAPTMAILSKQRPAKILEAFDKLSDLLKRRQDLDDWILCELAAIEYIEQEQPELAINKLREILKIAPRHQQTLEHLRSLYDRTGDYAGYEEVLKRLTGIYTDRQTLKQTYLTLAHHLMDRRGQLNEARLYLERVLRLDPTAQDALFTLGESYVLGKEPLRAIKAFGSAARAAQANEDYALAASLHSKIATIWHEALEHDGEALLSSRRALQLLELLEQPDELIADQRLDAMEQMALLSQAKERHDEALACWQDVVAQLEARLEQARQAHHTSTTATWASPALAAVARLQDDAPADGTAQIKARLIRAHEHLGEIYTYRERFDAASTHWRRVLELDPNALVATEQMEQDLRHRGRPEDLIAFYRERIELSQQDDQRLGLCLKLAQVYEQMGMVEESQLHLQEALRINPAHLIARARLSDILMNAGRFETLRHALQTLLVRMSDRQAKYDIIIELANLQVTNLKQPRQGARGYFEALDIRSSDRTALEGARLALEDIIHAEGVMAPAPVGTGAVGRLQERVLLKLADLSSSPHDQIPLLDEVVTLAMHRQDEDAISEARRRIEALRQEVQESQDIDTRVDDLLHVSKKPNTVSKRRFQTDYLKHETQPKAPKFSLPSTPATQPKVEEIDAPPEAPTSDARTVVYEEVIPVEEDTSTLQEDTEAPKVAPKLASFRDKLQKALTQPSKVDKNESESPWKNLLQKSVEMQAKTDNLPPVPAIDLPETHSEPRGNISTLGLASGVRSGLINLSEVLDDAWDSMAQLSQIDSARQADDPALLVKEIEGVLQQGPVHAHPHLDIAQYLALAKELGEALFYDLEDSERAKNYLELVKNHDPDGLGQHPSLLNALESIYEEDGHLEARIALLTERMNGSQNKDMATTYRLLIAQLLWDEKQDAPSARSHLQKILDEDAKHEAAHRMLAKMATDQQDWQRAAEHLEVVLTDRVGGLDEVELERQLADIYLHHLQQPQRARTRYEGVLEASPADAQALEGIKQCQAMLLDWSGYLKSLGKELGLLLGQHQGIELSVDYTLNTQDVPAPLRTAASQIIADAAQVAQDEQKDKHLAHHLWGLAHQLWPDQVEALEARIELGRQIQSERLPEDLQNYAAMLFDANAQFEAMYEAAKLYLNDPATMEQARSTLAEAIAIVQDEGHEKLDEARRLLHSL